MSISDASILRLNDCDTIRFVELYETEHVLWNPQDPKYHNRDARDAAAQRVATELNIVNFTAKHVIMKFKNLRSSYLQEIKKIKESTKTGCSYKDAYVPKVIWFPVIDRFLKAHVKSRKAHLNLDGSQIQATQQTQTQDDTKNPLIPQNTEVRDNQNACVLLNRNEQKQNSMATSNQITSGADSHNHSSSILSKKRRLLQISNARSKRRRRAATIGAISTISNFDIALQKLDDISKRALSSLNHNDQLDAFGKYIASMLRSLPTTHSLAIQQQMVSLLIQTQISAQTSADTPTTEEGAAL